MIVLRFCYDFWYEVRCELVVVRMNVCDMEVVVVVECCGVDDCVMTGGSVEMTGEVTMVGNAVGVWVAKVGRIGRCASVVCSDG